MVSVKVPWVLPEEGLGTHLSSSPDEARCIMLGGSRSAAVVGVPAPCPPQTPAIFTLKAIQEKEP